MSFPISVAIPHYLGLYRWKIADDYLWSKATYRIIFSRNKVKPLDVSILLFFFHMQVSEWAVDYGVSEGTDREGWQYAADFPA